MSTRDELERILLDFHDDYTHPQAVDPVRDATDELIELLADAFDHGVSIAGRYGHEDFWDADESPYEENPWREG